MTVYSTLGMGTQGSTWQAGGYCGAGNVADLIGSLRGRPAAVAGNALPVFDEIAILREKYEMDLVIFAANDVGMYMDRLDHWVSLHTPKLEHWKAVRWGNGYGADDVRIHSIQTGPSVEFVWDQLTPTFALSGYLAMQIAWIMGASPIILCGCPGSPRRRFFDGKLREDFGYGGGTGVGDQGVQDQIRKEMSRLPDLRASVRSMSGWTAEFFGCPEGI